MWLSSRARIHNVHLYQKTVTGPRFLNFLRLLIGHYQNLLLKRRSIKARPFALSVEPTRYCQLRCPECPTGAGILHRSGGDMPIILFSEIIDETKHYIFHLNLYFQGEPLLHPEITQFVQKASENRIYTSISTNGQNLDTATCHELVKAGLSRIIISLDGLSQKTYETYRVNGDVEKVKNGIR